MVLQWISSLGILYITLLVSVQCQNIPACIENAVSSRTVECDGQDLRGLDNSVFSRVDELQINTIVSVHIFNCTISNLDFLDSDYLQRVKLLYLESLQGLSDSHLSSLVTHISISLEQLEITNNPSLKSVDALIPSSDFGSEWSNLKKFRVQNNDIDTIDSRLFNKINGPDEYNLRGNSLSTLDLSQHNAVTSVRRLLLSNNLLTTITGLQQFNGLEELDLADNRLINVDDFVSNVLDSSRLEVLNLKNNLIETFNPAGPILDDISSLTIDLQNNKLRTVTNLGQSLARKVQSLILRENANLKIETDTFQDLEKLEQLEMSECGITEITTHLQNLTNLKLLSLNGNHLSELSSQAFVGTTNLEEIYLQSNQLKSLGFMTSNLVTLEMLSKLDVSLNQLDNLANFVSAPQLEVLKMDGGPDNNGFNQLSSCLTFTELPSTLRIVCARNLRVKTLDSCQYQSFLDLLVVQSVIYNNDDCCDKASCDESNSPSSYPSQRDCPTWDELCTVDPGSTTVPPRPRPGTVTDSACEIPVRAEFQELYDSEMIVIAMGYILALLFLVILIILFLRRYRSYDKWLKDHQQREHEKNTALQTLRRSTETLDCVDGRIACNSPKGTNGTLQKSKAYAQKSLDNISMASGYSQYSTANGKSPFMGRRKFKDACSLDVEEQSMRYTGPSTKGQRLNSGEDSPTAMSVYSYASHQPERRRPSESNTPPTERRRHRSGGAVQRMDSGDLLNLVDEDILPPRIQVVLQRKATERRSHGEVSTPIARNSRPYGTTPYRTKARSSGMVKKKTHSPLLTVVNKGTRRSGSRTPTIVKRALPDIPLDSQGSVSSSLKSASSITSNTSKLSHSSMLRHNAVFTDGNAEEAEYHETDTFGLG